MRSERRRRRAAEKGMPVSARLCVRCGVSSIGRAFLLHSPPQGQPLHEILSDSAARPEWAAPSGAGSRYGRYVMKAGRPSSRWVHVPPTVFAVRAARAVAQSRRWLPPPSCTLALVGGNAGGPIRMPALRTRQLGACGSTAPAVESSVDGSVASAESPERSGPRCSTRCCRKPGPPRLRRVAVCGSAGDPGF
jgi:hypothetical protein